MTKSSGGVTALNLYLCPCQEFGNELVWIGVAKVLI